MRDKNGRFIDGFPPRKVPIGTVKIRTRHKRNSEQRAFIKIAEPNRWILLARYNWEKVKGPIPRGHGIHHKDHNKLNDDFSNLELTNKAEHLDLHRAEFKEKAMASFAETRRERRWTTKSATKRTGRPPRWTDEDMQLALAEIKEGKTQEAVSTKYNISVPSLVRRIRGEA